MKLWLLFCLSALSADVKNWTKESTPAGVAIPVSATDLRVVRRALEILSAESAWNRKDNRECPASAVRFSLYCALFRASVEVKGEFDHRLGALEEVRRAVEAASIGKNYEHRLMDFNNDASTRWKDVRAVLQAAEKRIAARLAH